MRGEPEARSSVAPPLLVAALSTEKTPRFLRKRSTETAERPAHLSGPLRWLRTRRIAGAAGVRCSVWILIMASLQRVHWSYQQPVTLFRGDHDEILQPAAPILLWRRSPCQNTVPLHP